MGAMAEVTRDSLPEFAATFVAALPAARGARAHIVGLSGDLGAGKTTFVQNVARALGAGDTVVSPTFVFAQRHPINHPVFEALIHIDAYRLEPGEASTIGWQQYAANPAYLVLVEWPEKMGGDFPLDAPILTFSVTGEDTRTITYA